MKLLVTVVCFTFLSIGQISAQLSLSLRPGHNDDLCPGFEVANQAIIDIRNMPPITPNDNTSVEYYWVVQHEDGTTWSWQTDIPARAFLIPFAGEYTLRCQILYITVGNVFPYAAFWSSPMLIRAGDDCGG
ncbi:MAG: hypothetical protein AAF828_07690 [Bacteroidota bacterium]